MDSRLRLVVLIAAVWSGCLPPFRTSTRCRWPRRLVPLPARCRRPDTTSEVVRREYSDATRARRHRRSPVRWGRAWHSWPPSRRSQS